MRSNAIVIVSLLLAGALPQGQDQRSTVRTSTAGVLVDVTVVDKDGRPVTDLKPEDFEVTEDGKPQRVVSTTLMRGGVPVRLSGDGAAAAATGTSAAGPAAGAVTAVTPTVTAILFDSLASDSRAFATRAAAQFVSTLATG